MNFKYLLILCIIFFSALGVVSCGGGDKGVSIIADDVDDVDDVENDIPVSNFINPNNHEQLEDYAWNASDEVLIYLEGESISIVGEGAYINGTVLTISSAGIYRLSGALYDGQIIVDTEDDELVRLIFDGIEISSSTSAPVYIKNVGKAIIVLANETANTITDAESYLFDSADDNEPNAAIFSKDDLTFYGEGSLTVYGNYNDGITSKDGLLIAGGNISIQSVDDGVRGKDYLIIQGGSLNINAQGDGIKSDDESEGLGYISITSGTLNITALGDAIQAKSNVQIEGGNFILSSGGGSNKALANDASAKGIKAAVNIFIDGGDFSIDSADDTIHSNNGITINGGLINLSSGDDGIHADTKLIVNGGDINIYKSYEGVESAVIVLNEGKITLVSSDDGINVAGGNDNSGGFVSGGSVSGDYYLEINGGYFTVNAAGDGIDVNGNIDMSGGTVLVNGPTENFNGPLDYDGTFNISGGLLVAVGSSGMAQGPSSSSTQEWLGVNFSSIQSAGQFISLQKSDGESIITFEPAKNYQSFVVSSAAIVESETYDLYVGGSSTGSNENGLYTGGVYSGGSLAYTFEGAD